MHLRLLSFVLIAFLLGGCSMFSFFDEDEPVEEGTAEELYTQGVAAVEDNDYLLGKTKFEAVDRKHPFSDWATPAQINLIYTNFKLEEYDDTVSASERFIRLHPRHKDVAYAFYMRGLSHYRQISNANLDQNQARKAQSAFRELVSRFPKSDYAWQAKQMLVLCLDRLAEQEMVVARYYLDRSEYIAALNRFDEVVKNPEYKNTTYFQEALFSMVLAAHNLGLKEEAKNYAVVLGHNFPDDQFYQMALDLIEGRSDITSWALSKLRKPVEEGDFIERFMKGLKPGMRPF
ncbi:MAG: outer membrane protein assembly factor BamD [Magnetococcales bacterium]|nr:outer membrane protein assembly factor BamD [Magnetococcales bacterium]